MNNAEYFRQMEELQNLIGSHVNIGETSDGWILAFAQEENGNRIYFVYEKDWNDYDVISEEDAKLIQGE